MNEATKRPAGNGYREIMEKHLGRKLDNKEHVHHINGDPWDNRIENLQVMSAKEHMRYHASLRAKKVTLYGSWRMRINPDKSIWIENKWYRLLKEEAAREHRTVKKQIDHVLAERYQS